MQGTELQVAKKRVGRYPKEFRRVAVERLKSCVNIVALSRELGVHRRLLYNGGTNWTRLRSQKNRRHRIHANPHYGKRSVS